MRAWHASCDLIRKYDFFDVAEHSHSITVRLTGNKFNGFNALHLQRYLSGKAFRNLALAANLPQNPVGCLGFQCVWEDLMIHPQLTLQWRCVALSAAVVIHELLVVAFGIPFHSLGDAISLVQSRLCPEDSLVLRKAAPAANLARHAWAARVQSVPVPPEPLLDPISEEAFSEDCDCDDHTFDAALEDELSFLLGTARTAPFQQFIDHYRLGPLVKQAQNKSQVDPHGSDFDATAFVNFARAHAKYLKEIASQRSEDARAARANQEARASTPDAPAPRAAPQRFQLAGINKRGMATPSKATRTPKQKKPVNSGGGKSKFKGLIKVRGKHVTT